MTKDPFEPFAVDVLNSLAAHIAVLDAQGVVVAVNEAWRRFARENGSLDDDCYVGTNYLATCEAALQHSGDDTAEVALQGIQAVLGGHLASASLEYPCHAPNEHRWFVVHITRFMHAGINWLLGISDMVPGTDTLGQLIRRADRALCLAKEAGRNRTRVVLSPPALR